MQTSIPWAVRHSWLKNAYLCRLLDVFFGGGIFLIFSSKVGHTEQVLGVPSGFISRSVHSKLQVPQCSSYNLSIPG